MTSSRRWLAAAAVAFAGAVTGFSRDAERNAGSLNENAAPPEGEVTRRAVRAANRY